MDIPPKPPDPTERPESPGFAYAALGTLTSGCSAILAVLTLGALPAALFLKLPAFIVEELAHRTIEPDAWWGLATVTSAVTCCTLFASGVVAQALKASGKSRAALWFFLLSIVGGCLVFPIVLAMLNSTWNQ